MDDIDFIKKCMAYTEGFDLQYFDDEWCFGVDGSVMFHIESVDFEKGYYRLLLQETIEGINKGWSENREIGTIKQFSYDIVTELTQLEEGRKSYGFEEYGSIIKAKRAALEYVFKQKSKDDKTIIDLMAY